MTPDPARDAWAVETNQPPTYLGVPACTLLSPRGFPSHFSTFNELHMLGLFLIGYKKYICLGLLCNITPPLFILESPSLGKD